MKRRIGIIFCVFLLYVVTLFGQSDFVEVDTITQGKDKVHTYEHQITGMDVIWIECDDPNASFVLGVRTPVQDNTGVNHIIEHTIFKGSRKYPSYQVFFDASAKYPHSFMNAMTSADMTYYPFSTPYPKCFERLLDVYLDSIFHPLLLEQPYSFYEEAYYKDRQTGKEGGVVYNEMKGATGSIERQVFRSIRDAYFKGSTYGYDSGGSPSSIPELTYRQFKETYEKYYYPGNMMVILYGNVPIERTLESLDESISKFETNRPPVTIDMPIEKKEKEIVATYTTDSSKGIVLKSFLIDTLLTEEDEVGLSLWVSTYLQDPNGYFQKKLRDYGLDNVQIIKDEGMRYPVYTLAISDVPMKNLESMKATLEEALKEIEPNLKSDLAKEADMLAKQKLVLWQEADSSQRGLRIATTYLENWIHEGKAHSYYTQLEKIKKMNQLDDGYKELFFIKAIQKDITLIPTKHSNSTMNVAENQLEIWDGIGKKIEEWKVGHEKDLLPNLTSKELIISQDTDCDISEKQGITYMLTPINNHTLYTTFYYPTHHISQKELPYLFLYGMMLEEAAKELTPFRGFIEVKPIAFNHQDGLKTYLKMTILEDEERAEPLKFVEKLQEELDHKPPLWYAQKLKKWQLVFRERFSADLLATLQNLNEAGNEGAGRYLFESHYPLYQFVDKLMRVGDEGVLAKLEGIGDKLHLTKGSYIGLMGEEKQIKKIKKEISVYCKENRSEIPEAESYQFKKYPSNNIYYRAGGVDYLVYSYENLDKIVNGTDYVMAAYATLDYLQPIIRGEEGAYGSGMNVITPYRVNLYTYRDPSYKRSMEIIDQMGSILKRDLSQEKLELAKTEALCSYQRQYRLLGSPLEQGEMLQKIYLSGLKPSYLKKTQKEIVECSQKDLEKKLEDLHEIIKKSRVGICTQKNKAPTDFNGTIYE